MRNLIARFTALLICIAITASCARQEKPMKLYKAGGNNGIVGRLKWVITDEALSKVISQGERDVKLTEIKLFEMSADALSIVRKTITLSDGFSISFAGQFAESKSEIGGFGFTADREPEQLFSWEWFKVAGDTRATKLQESGELGIQFGEVGGKWEIIHTEFLTDVSFRLMELTGQPRGSPKYRIKILKGSAITWPSLMSGKAVAN